jgi:inosine-uridine nucleoside N-ribohydrolase
VFDCDPGCDDALAIGLVVQHQLDPNEVHYLRVDILTVAGNVSVDQTTGNAARVLLACFSDKLGDKDRFLQERFDQELGQFSIFRGCSKAMDGREPSASSVHGRDGLGDAPNSLIWGSEKAEKGAALKVIKRMLLPEGPKLTAAERLMRLATDGEAFDLLCTGPLTNLACALSKMNREQQTKFWSLCERAVIMGGSFDARGNITHSAEFNAFADPAAVQSVLDSFGQCVRQPGSLLSDKRLHFVTLDSTENVAIPLDRIDSKGSAFPAAPFLQYALKQYGHFHVYHCQRPQDLVKAGVIERFNPVKHAWSQIAGKSGDQELKRFCYLHDPLAAWVLLSGGCEKQIWNDSVVRIDTSRGECRGRIILCQRRAENESRPIVIPEYGTPVKWLSLEEFTKVDKGIGRNLRDQFIEKINKLLGISTTDRPSAGASAKP